MLNNISLDKRTFFGFSYQDYNNMFGLTTSDLELNILEVAGGLNTFFKHRVQQEGKIVSCNDLVSLNSNNIEFDIKSLDKAIDNLKAIKNNFITEIDFEKYLNECYQNAEIAFEYFNQHKNNDKLWIPNTLPKLNIETGTFELALCPFYFFVNDHLFDIEYQTNSILELSRVASEVRIYPLINVQGENSENLAKVLLKLQEETDLTAEIIATEYNLLEKANAMLKIKKISCEL